MKVLREKLSNLIIREEARPDPQALKKALITFLATAAMMVFAIGLMALLQTQYPDMPFQALESVGLGGSIGMMVAGLTVAGFILGLYLYNTCRKKEEPKPDTTSLPKPAPKVASAPATPPLTFPDEHFANEYNRVISLFQNRPPGSFYHSFVVGHLTKIIKWKEGKENPTFEHRPNVAMRARHNTLVTEGYRQLELPSSPTDNPT